MKGGSKKVLITWVATLDKGREANGHNSLVLLGRFRGFLPFDQEMDWFVDAER